MKMYAIRNMETGEFWSTGGWSGLFQNPSHAKNVWELSQKGVPHGKVRFDDDATGLEVLEITIVEVDELEELQDRSEWLACLEEAGVDNWEGMEHAADIAREKGQESK